MIALAITACGAPAQWQSLNGGLDFFVGAFEHTNDSTQLIVGGAFCTTNVDSLAAHHLVRWDGIQWSDTGFAGGGADTLFGCQYHTLPSIALFHDTLFVAPYTGGWRYDTSLAYIAMLADTTWLPCGQPNAPAWLHEVNGRLFRGGLADSVYGTSMPSPNEWIGGAWQPLPNNPIPAPSAVYEAHYHNGVYYFGGIFEALGSRKIVAFDGVDQWCGLDGGVPGFYFIASIQGYGDSLFVGGWLQEPGLSDHIRVWDGSDWLQFAPNGITFVNHVWDMLVHEGDLYIAGAGHLVGDTTIYDIWRYDGHQLCALGGPTVGGGQKMTIFQDDLYFAMPSTHAELYQEFIGRLDLDAVVPDTCIEVVHVGVEEQHGVPRVYVHPNPASDVVTIGVNTGVMGGNLLVYDEIGRLIASQSAVQRSVVELDVSRWAVGTYTALLFSPAGLYRSRLMIVH
ncbi:MAG: T9SS type A sorting domain-containing protein [Flavobacteriales bacterium]|nr:MAG: T9SS type A sorting domain-containing protein [Flavobacteriales bacterium]